MIIRLAKNILKSGLKLSAFNRTINKAEPLKEFGAEISKTLSEVVKDKDYVITMLTDDSAVDAIMSNHQISVKAFSMKVSFAQTLRFALH